MDNNLSNEPMPAKDTQLTLSPQDEQQSTTQQLNNDVESSSAAQTEISQSVAIKELLVAPVSDSEKAAVEQPVNAVIRPKKNIIKLILTIACILGLTLLLLCIEYFAFRTIADSSASTYNNEVSTYLDKVYDAISSNLSNPSDAKSAIGKLSNPNLSVVPFGQLSVEYIASQTKAKDLKLKIDDINKSVNDLVIIQDFQNILETGKNAMSKLDADAKFNVQAQTYIDSMTPVKEAAAEYKAQVSGSISNDFESIATNLDIEFTQLRTLIESDNGSDSESALMSNSEFRTASTKFYESQTRIEAYNEDVNGKLAAIADDIRMYKSTLLQTNLDTISNNKWKKIAVGWDHTCGIGLNDKAYCWGNNTNGQLGNGSTENSRVPVAVSTTGPINNNTIKDIAVNNSTSCVIASDDKAYCWGGNSWDSLGNTSVKKYTSVPVSIDTTGALKDKTIKAIDMNGDYSCVIASDDQLYCWGGSFTGRSTTPKLASNTGALKGRTIVEVSVGSNYTCVIADDHQVYCWAAEYNAYGNTATSKGETPTIMTGSGVLSGKTIKSLAAGYYHVCVIASDDKAYCWGYKSALGTDKFSSIKTLEPVAVSTSGALNGKTIKGISAGYYQTCAVASDDNLYCWGETGMIIVGQVQLSDNLLPAQINVKDLKVKTVYSGYNYTCLIASDDSAYCGGNNQYGQLGSGDNKTSSTPVLVKESE